MPPAKSVNWRPSTSHSVAFSARAPLARDAWRYAGKPSLDPTRRVEHLLELRPDLVLVNSLVVLPQPLVQWGLIASKALLLLAVTATAMRSRMDLLLGMGWRAAVPVFTATLVSFGVALTFAYLLL